MGVEKDQGPDADEKYDGNEALGKDQKEDDYDNDGDHHKFRPQPSEVDPNDQLLLESQKMLDPFKKVGAIYGFTAKLWSGVKGLLSLAGVSIGIAAKILPPLQTAIAGFFTLLTLVELVCLSKKIRTSEALGIFNSVTSMILGPTSLILAMNPETALLGSVLSLASITMGTLKSVYDYVQTKTALKTAQEKYDLDPTVEENAYDLEKQKYALLQRKNGLIMSTVSLLSASMVFLCNFAVIAAALSPPGIAVSSGIGAVLTLAITLKSIKDRFYTPQPIKGESFKIRGPGVEPRPEALSEVSDTLTEDLNKTTKIIFQRLPSQTNDTVFESRLTAGENTPREGGAALQDNNNAGIRSENVAPGSVNPTAENSVEGGAERYKMKTKMASNDSLLMSHRSTPTASVPGEGDARHINADSKKKGRQS